MDCSPPGSSVHGILQAILEWVAISFSRGSSQPRDRTRVLPHCRQTLYPLSYQGSPNHRPYQVQKHRYLVELKFRILKNVETSLVVQWLRLCLPVQGVWVWSLFGEPGGGNFTYPQSLKASLVAQLLKNPPAMQETWLRPLGWEDPLEKGKAPHSSILAWRIPWTV